MLSLTTASPVYLACGTTDMRKSIDGLAAIVQEQFALDPFSAMLKWYEEQFRLAQQKRFGVSSEKTHPDQLELNLFNEAEVTAMPEPEHQKEQITYKRSTMSGKRETDFAKLPVETVKYTLDESEQICDCCGGALHEMTTETRREIAVVPPQVKVVEHVRQVCLPPLRAP